jgi:hypothetical protein
MHKAMLQKFKRKRTMDIDIKISKNISLWSKDCCDQTD